MGHYLCSGRHYAQPKMYRQDPCPQGAHGLVTIIQRDKFSDWETYGIVPVEIECGLVTTVWILILAVVD